MSQTYTFDVAMTCGGCEKQVRKVLGKLGDQVSDVQVNLDDKTVQVTTTLTKDEILQTLQKTGKETKPR